MPFCCIKDGSAGPLGRQPGKKKGYLGNWSLEEMPEVSTQEHQ